MGLSRTIFTLLLLCTLYYSTYSQVLENTGLSVKWKQINTPHFNILFPQDFNQQAQKVANIMENVYAPVTQTLEARPKPVSVILRNSSSYSNAFVSMTPRRTEFFNMPPQDYNFIGNNDWYDLIGVHEFRHVVQYQQANQGINRAFYYLFGYVGLSSIANLTYPDWFWEGDAVVTETGLTSTGRGSIPHFGLNFRTNLMEGRTFNYHKQSLGSYKHNIPNHYVLGYHMVSYLRERTGDPLIWSKITARAAHSSIIPFAFSNAIKKETGVYLTQLYKEMARDLNASWQQSIDNRILTSYDVINERRSKAYTDYNFPQQFGDESILALKSGIGDIASFVKLKGNTEQKIHVPGTITDTGMLSATRNRFVWVENMFDPRWLAKNYSVIKAYDATTKKSWTVLSNKSRYAAAAISPDGKQVATVRTTVEYNHNLLIIDLDRNSIIKEFPNPNNYFYSMPRWSDDGVHIVMLQTSPTGKSVVWADMNTGQFEEIIAESNENIGHPVIHKDYLLYNSAIDGIDNIYAFNLKNKTTHRVTSSRYGSYNPAVSGDGNTLYYNEQGRNGMDVVRKIFDPTAWELIDRDILSKPHSLDQTIIEQEDNKHLMDTIPQKEFPISKYNRTKGIINPYSWGPYFDNSLSYLELGIRSQDILSTTSMATGYRYDAFEKTGKWFGDISFQGLFPIIDLGVTYGNRSDDRGAYGRDIRFKWTETTFMAGVRVPLVLTKSKYLTSLSIANSFAVRSTQDFSSVINVGDTVIIDGSDRYVPVGQNDDEQELYYLFSDQTDFGQLLFNRFRIDYTHFLKRSKRDINPKFGQYLSAENYSTPFGGDYQGGLTAVRGIFYFPGLFKHHSIYFRADYQKMLNEPQLDTYSFANRIFKPRGFSYPRQSEFYSLSANYSLPICYPDISLGPLLNIQRIKANLFYDYGEGDGYYYLFNLETNQYLQADAGATYQSFGAELTADFNLFRLPILFELGLRVSKIPASQTNPNGLVYEFLIGSIAF